MNYFLKHEVEKQWSNLDVKGDDDQSIKDEAKLAQIKATVPSLSWSDYQFKILPFDARDTNDTRRINT